MGRSGRAAWGTAGVPWEPGGRRCRALGTKGGPTYPMGGLQHCLLRNMDVWGQTQAIQTKHQCCRPSYWCRCHQCKGCKGGSAGQCCRRCRGRRHCQGAALWGLRLRSLHSPEGAWSSFSLTSSRLDTRMSSRISCLPAQPSCLCCLRSHFRTYAMPGGQRQPAGKGHSGRGWQPASPRGSLKCPKPKTWAPPGSCLLQGDVPA